MDAIGLRSIASALRGEVSGDQVLAPGPGHSLKDRSLSVRLGDNGELVVNSFAGDDALVCKDYVRKQCGLPEWRPNGNAKRNGVAREYIYKQADGTNYLRVSRTADKRFFQSHWDGKAWVNGRPKGPKIPYLLPALVEFPDEPVYVVEGEKDADRLASLDLVATTSSEGAGKWTADLNEHFRGRTVYVIPDNDEPGRKHARRVVDNLRGIAASVAIIELPGLPPKGDVSDWLDAGNTIEELATLAANALPDTESPPIAPLIKSSREFVKGFIPPDYLVDGVLQRKYFYALTARTGAGKTSIALLLAACVALAKQFGGHDTEKGRVLIFAGENPDDIRARWIALSLTMGFDADTINVHFIPGVFKISTLAKRITEEVDALGGVALIIIDTSAAYYESDDENSNTQQGEHARRLRSLVELKGGPCVVVNCHPPKGADDDNLSPRGGGSFVAEVDGNLTAMRDDTTVTVHWQVKFRGAEFAPMAFLLRTNTYEKLRDSKGRLIPMVTARHLTDTAQEEMVRAARGDEDLVLEAMTEGATSVADIAKAVGWYTPKHDLNRSKAQRVLTRLKKHKCVAVERGHHVLTDKGKKALKKETGDGK
jgi:AAA domain